MGFSQCKADYVRDLLRAIEEGGALNIISVEANTVPWVPEGGNVAIMVEEVYLRVARGDESDEAEVWANGADGLYQ